MANTSKQPEKIIENEILEWLNNQPGCWFWKNNNHAVFDPTRRTFRTKTKWEPKGLTDIQGFWKEQMIFIEVKRPPPNKTYPSADQKEFIARAISHGAIAFVARSLDDVQEQLFSGQIP